MMKDKDRISVIIPCMNEEENIHSIYQRINSILKNEDFEVLFIDDGSTDNTLQKIKDLKLSDPRVRYISFSRNFGHQNALKAGYDYMEGDCAICVDADLQQPPELFTEMIKKWREGYDIVYTIRNDKKNTGIFKRTTAKIFYSIINRFSDIKVKHGAADFRLIDRKVADVVKNMNENFLFLRGLFFWLGFKQYAISYIPEKRMFGKTKYSTRRMMKFALNGITSMSAKPLRISIYLGILIALFAFIYGMYAIYTAIFTGKAITGWASLLVSVLFIGGIQLIILGIIGEYLGKLFMENKRRPNYIIREIN